MRGGGGGGGAVYLVVPSLVATPLQQPFFNSGGAGLQRGVRELEVGLRRRARALGRLGRATTGRNVSGASASPRALPRCAVIYNQRVLRLWPG